MTLNDVYTPAGQAPTPYSLEGMWEDHAKRMKEVGWSDEAIASLKPSYYHAVFALTDELLHFVPRNSRGGQVILDYHRQSCDEVLRDIDSPILEVPPAKSLGAN